MHSQIPPPQGRAQELQGSGGYLPSSSVLSCSSISVQSMREMTPFCRVGTGVSGRMVNPATAGWGAAAPASAALTMTMPCPVPTAHLGEVQLAARATCADDQVLGEEEALPLTLLAQ